MTSIEEIAEPIDSDVEGELNISNDDTHEGNVSHELNALKSSRILVVDDDEENADIVVHYLKSAGFTDVQTENISTRVLMRLIAEQPSLVLLDVRMPQLNGLELLARIREHGRTQSTPVVFLTASSDAKTKRKALDLGANGFLTKPIDPSELTLCVQNVLGAQAYQAQLLTHSQHLERQVYQRTVELNEARQDIQRCLARAAEFRDDNTGAHIRRVGLYVGITAKYLGFDDVMVGMFNEAAQLHDTGKIAISDDILKKRGKLTEAEFAKMREHCEFGRQILSPTAATFADQQSTKSPMLNLASSIALTHHEKWDGSGYPQGLQGEAIPIEGRITAVADVFDALSNPRSYKPAFHWKRCFEILEEGRGSHFDPRVLSAFFDGQDEILRVHRRLGFHLEEDRNAIDDNRS